MNRIASRLRLVAALLVIAVGGLLASGQAGAAPVTVTQGTPIDLGAGWVPEAINSSDEVAMVKFGTSLAARWDAGTVEDLLTPAWLQPADGGSIQSVTGISDAGTVVGNGVVSGNTDPNLATTNDAGATADMYGTVGLIWAGDSTQGVEVDPPAVNAWAYEPAEPTLTISGISASGTIAINDLYMPVPTVTETNVIPGQTYIVPELANSDGADIKSVPDPGGSGETLGQIAGNDIVVSTCENAPTEFYDTCQPGGYVANRVATVSPLATETVGLDLVAGVAADGTVVGTSGDQYVEELPSGQQRVIPDPPIGVVNADEVMVVTNHGDAIWQGSCGNVTLVSSLFPPDSGWSGIDVIGWNSTGDLIGEGDLDGGLHGWLLRPVLASCAAPTVTNLAPSSGPASGGTVVTITGTGFASGAVVQFGSATATDVSVQSTTEIVATAPAGTGSQNVQVTLNGLSSPPAAANLFTYEPASPVTTTTTTTTTTTPTGPESGNSSGSSSSSGSSTGGSNSGSPVAISTATPKVITSRPATSGTNTVLKVSCAAATGSDCQVTLTLTTTETVKVTVGRGSSKKTRKTKKTITIGSSTTTITAGGVKTVSVPLNSAGKRLLTSQHTIHATLTTRSAGHLVSTQTITVREPKKAQHDRGHRRLA
jgi:IPT/TIG domain